MCDNMKNVQITEELFCNLLNYFLLENETNENYEIIKKQLNEKLDKIIKHDLYTKYKTSETEEEREKARQEYLERVGIHKDFRW